MATGEEENDAVVEEMDGGVGLSFSFAREEKKVIFLFFVEDEECVDAVINVGASGEHILLVVVSVKVK